MKAGTAVPPRIHVIVARQAPVAVVFRRGPSKLATTFLWDLESNSVTIGQWFKGRIYSLRADLSPDGKHMIYFAMDGRWSREAKGSWTAVSRAPFLKAIALYPKGDCWFGGGLWKDNTRYWLNGGPERATLESQEVVAVESIDLPAGRISGECPGIYFNRLIRDGWQVSGGIKVEKHKEEHYFVKAISEEAKLLKRFHSEIDHPIGRGCYWEEHEVVLQSGATVECPDWEWADVWRGNLLWASNGCLYRSDRPIADVIGIRRVADLNDLTFEAIAAPY